MAKYAVMIRNSPCVVKAGEFEADSPDEAVAQLIAANEREFTANPSKYKKEDVAAFTYWNTPRARNDEGPINATVTLLPEVPAEQTEEDRKRMASLETTLVEEPARHGRGKLRA